MPRTGGVYSPPAGTKGVPNTTIQSVPYNTLIDDLAADANAPRPVTAGGTGATSATGARTNIGADNASNLTQGTIDDARLPGTMAAKSFSGPVNITYGASNATAEMLRIGTLDGGAAGKPFLYVRKEVSPATWTIGLWGTGVEGALNLNAGTVNMNAALTGTSASFTGALLASTATFTGNQIEIQGVAPRIRLSDTSAGQHDYWLYADGNNFYVLGDRNDDGTWETPHPLALNSSSNTGQLFGSDFWTTANFNPAAKADLAGAAFSGSVSAPSFTSSGNMNIDGNSLNIRGAGNRHIWFATNTGVNRALMYHEQATDKLVWNLYDAAGAHTRSMEYRRSDGALNVQGFISTNGHVAVGGSTLYADGNIYMTRYGTYLSAILDSKITAEGRCYPRRIGGGDLNFNWSGQSGQPSWLWGGNDGSNMYVYNPSNFNVNYANGAGNADTVDGCHAIDLAQIYKGSNANETNLPIGTMLVVSASSLVKNRNADIGVRLWNSDNLQYVADGFGGASGALLAGTWRARGITVDDGFYFNLVQRVA